jgi:hypothetical protein
MTIEQTAGKLAAWRDLATAAGRAEAGPGGSFVPRGTRIEAKAAECCPWTKDGGCPVCQVEREHPFAVANLPGRAFMCLTFLRF